MDVKKRIKYLFIFGLCSIFLWWIYQTPKDSFKEFKTAGVIAANSQERLSSQKVNASHSLSKKALLHQSRKPAQVRRELPLKMKEAFELREKKERKQYPLPDRSELTQTEIIQGSLNYIFLKNTRAFKLSSDIQRQYPEGFTHLGFWIAKDESFSATEAGLFVVYNEMDKAYGVVTGVLKVKMQDMRDQSDFLVSTGGEVFQAYDHILVTLFKYQEKDALLEAQKFCEKDMRFSLCEIEVLERGRFAR